MTLPVNFPEHLHQISYTYSHIKHSKLILLLSHKTCLRSCRKPDKSHDHPPRYLCQKYGNQDPSTSFQYTDYFTFEYFLYLSLLLQLHFFKAFLQHCYLINTKSLLLLVFSLNTPALNLRLPAHHCTTATQPCHGHSPVFGSCPPYFWLVVTLPTTTFVLIFVLIFIQYLQKAGISIFLLVSFNNISST